MHWIFIQKQYRWTHAGDIAENEFVSGRYESNHKGPGCSMADDIYQADSYEHTPDIPVSSVGTPSTERIFIIR